MPEPGKFNIYRQAYKINESLDRSLAAFARHVNTKCDWKDADDVTFWKKVNRRKRRRKVLDELVPDRKCPCCGETRIGPGEWMVRMDGSVVLCRSCYARLRPKTGVIAAGLFQPETRWVVDGKALRQIRIDAGISQRDFALLIGVSSARVHQIEEHAKSISNEQKERIVDALKSCGVVFITE